MKAIEINQHLNSLFHSVAPTVRFGESGQLENSECPKKSTRLEPEIMRLAIEVDDER